MGCPALTYHEKDDELNFLGLWKKSGGSEKSYKYYPFGLQTSTSWTRDNTKDNNYLYNAANELNKTSGWYEMFYRGYDPAIGRMLQVDPYATMYASFTTYNYAVNNPVMLNDPNGGQVAMQNNYGVSAMGVNRYNRIAGMSEAGDYYADWGEDFSFFESTMGGHFSWFEYKYTYTDHDGEITNWFEYKREWVPDDPDLVINNYGALPWDKVWGGIGVDFTYKNTKKYKDVRWVQTVWTNSPAKGAKSPYNDPAPPDGDDLPFFWDEDENYLHIDYDGTNANFRDNPRRPMSENSYWLAELSVVSKQSDGSYAAITTITYGFRIQDGKVQTFGIARDVVPSVFHQNSFNKKP